MIRKLFVAILALLAATAFAAVEVNKATQADLESIKGIGPVIATKILDERKKGAFTDWNDMVTRIRGVGTKNATKFSADGLTVNGAAYNTGTATAQKEGKPTMKANAKTPSGAASEATGSTTPRPRATDGTTTRTAAPTDEKRKEQAEERAANDAALAKKKAARRAAEEASAPASGTSASAPSKRKK